MNETTHKSNFLHKEVGKSWERHSERRDINLKIKFDTLLKRKGLFASKIYKKLGIDKADWSRIKWGIILPDISTQVKIAKELDCDSAILWGKIRFEGGGENG